MEQPRTQIEQLDSIEEIQDFKIYMISSQQTNKVYIGSTKLTLEERFWNHKSDAKSAVRKSNCRSRVLLNNFSDCKIDLIEETTKENKVVRERYWIEYYGDRSVNRCIPGRTRKEYRQQHAEQIKQHKKEYYRQHAEQIKQQRKEYYRQHAEQIKEWATTKITCDCGAIICQGSGKPRHLRSKKHKDYLASRASQEVIEFLTRQNNNFNWTICVSN